MSLFIGKLKNRSIIVLRKVYGYIYERKLQKKLKNDDFSIISSNCVGGVIYHRLHKKFLSSTINMWIKQDEFIKFVCNLKEYINMDWKLSYVKIKLFYRIKNMKA